MDNTPPVFLINPLAHFMEPGTVAFIPGWIILLITIFTFALLFPKFFKTDKNKNKIINPLLLAFIIGSLMPVFDDLLAFVFGPPFAHHSIFHSLLGSGITYIAFFVIATREIAKYALFGNLYHIFFNFLFDRVTLFFPLTYQEFGLVDTIGINTYWIKAVIYPILFALFFWAIISFFKRQRTVQK